jgi:hypothetical protein
MTNSIETHTIQHFNTLISVGEQMDLGYNNKFIIFLSLMMLVHHAYVYHVIT